MPYSYNVTTLGCQMNKSDSLRAEAILNRMGLVKVEDYLSADVVLINTCSVRDSAESRVFGLVNNLSKQKKKRPGLIVGVFGCLPGRDKDNFLRKKMPGVDLFFPTKDLIFLPKWLSEINPEFSELEENFGSYLSVAPAKDSDFQEFVTIQTGCNQFCTYCVVPFSRGMEVNRPLAEIMTELKSNAKRGVIEITFLGQIVNHYKAPDPENFSNENPFTDHFAKLLWEANQIPEVKRIHWTAPHPIYMNDEVIEALLLPKQLNFLHLPVQSGNSDILKKMNRKYSREYFLEVIRRVKSKKPDIAIGTDIIVGFSGETEEQFADTLSLYEECDFDIAYQAQYSERSGTLAAKNFKDNVSKEVKKERWFKVQKLMEKITNKKNKKYDSQIVEVLFDSFNKGFYEGNSREMKRVQVKSTENLIGKNLMVKINKTDTWMLWGDLIH